MALVRILVGAVWINGGLEKMFNAQFPSQFATSLESGGYISQAPAFFQNLMQSYVVPNAELVAQLARAGELVLGAALILGLLTNPAALFSALFAGAILLSQGGVGLGSGLGSPEFFNMNLLMVLLSLLVLLSPGAKTLALDSTIAEGSPALSPLLLNRRA